LLRLVMNNEQDEFLGYFPEFKIYTDIIEKEYSIYILESNKELEKYKGFFYSEKNYENKKKLALKIKDSKFKSYLFHCYNKKVVTMKEFLLDIERNKSQKYVEQKMLDALKIKDLSFEQ